MCPVAVLVLVEDFLEHVMADAEHHVGYMVMKRRIAVVAKRRSPDFSATASTVVS